MELCMREKAVFFLPVNILTMLSPAFLAALPCVTVLLEYLDLFHTKCAKLPFLGAHFSNFPPIFPAFCSLLLPKYFSKKFSGKIGASLDKWLALHRNLKSSQFIIIIIIITRTGSHITKYIVYV